MDGTVPGGSDVHPEQRLSEFGGSSPGIRSA